MQLTDNVVLLSGTEPGELEIYIDIVYVFFFKFFFSIIGYYNTLNIVT